MTSTSERDTRSAGDLLPMIPAAGAIAAFQAAAASLAVISVPVAATWVVTGGGEASWLDVVATSGLFWLLAQHVGLLLAGGGHLGLVPLGVAVVPFLACVFAGVRLARSLDPLAERIATGHSRATPSPAPRQALVTMAVVHGLIALLVAAFAVTPQFGAVIWQALFGPPLFALAGGWVGSAVYVCGGVRGAWYAVLDRVAALPGGELVTRALSPVAAALGTVAAAAALAIVIGLGFGIGRVIDLYSALGGGVLGVATITLLQLLLLPNLLIWVSSALIGPGFAIGAGSTVSPVATTLGPLPALPVLGALPPPGQHPGYVMAVLAVPVIAGAVGANMQLRLDALSPRGGWLGAVEDVAALAIGSGLAAGVLAWLSGGPAGPGRLGTVGPNPLLVAGAFAAEVAVGAVLLMLVRRAAPAAADRFAR